MPFVYVLKSLNYQRFYTGSTLDLERRLTEHNEGKSFYTRKYRPWKMVYIEEFGDLLSARKKEKYYKSAAGRRFLKKNVNIRE